MNYAIIENGVVANILWLDAVNAQEFPTAVKTDDRLIKIGDAYENGRFYRDGAEVLSPLEAARQTATDLAAYAAEIEYQIALNELGMEE